MKQKKGRNPHNLFLIAILICSILISACSLNEAPASDSALALYSLILFYDATDMKELGMTDEEAKEILENQKELDISDIKDSFASAGFTLSDELYEAVWQAQIDALKKLSYSAEIEKKGRKDSTVILTTNYIDVSKADMDAALAVADKVKKKKIKNIEKIGTLYAKQLIKNLAEIVPSTETNNITVEFEKAKIEVDGKLKIIWMPKDMESFAADVGKAVAK